MLSPLAEVDLGPAKRLILALNVSREASVFILGVGITNSTSAITSADGFLSIVKNYMSVCYLFIFLITKREQKRIIQLNANVSDK